MCLPISAKDLFDLSVALLACTPPTTCPNSGSKKKSDKDPIRYFVIASIADRAVKYIFMRTFKIDSMTTQAKPFSLWEIGVFPFVEQLACSELLFKKNDDPSIDLGTLRLGTNILMTMSAVRALGIGRKESGYPILELTLDKKIAVVWALFREGLMLFSSSSPPSLAVRCVDVGISALTDMHPKAGGAPCARGSPTWMCHFISAIIFRSMTCAVTTPDGTKSAIILRVLFHCSQYLGSINLGRLPLPNRFCKLIPH